MLCVQIVKMMILIVVIFAVCWLPQHVYFVVESLCPDITHHQSIQHVYLVSYWFAMSNAMYNPIIYCWMNARFVPLSHTMRCDELFQRALKT